MPVYDYVCPDCGHVEDKFVHDFTDKHSQRCGLCDEATQAVPSLTAISPDWEPYYDDVMETHVTSRSHRRDLMKKHGIQEKNHTVMHHSDAGKWI